MIDLWVVQKNLGSQKDYYEIKAACADIGCEFQGVSVIPFSMDIPDVAEDKSVIFYGSSNFTTNVHNSKKWYPAVFFDDYNFSYSTTIQRYGALVLNNECTILPMAELASLKIDEDKLMFFRPNRDIKEFAGMVMSFGEFKIWVEKLSDVDCELKVSTVAIASELREIEHEWRIFIMNGKFISGSHYREYGQLVVTDEVPEKVIKFVEFAAEKWCPAPVFVMDIAQVNGALYILETNGFNSSGFYKSDIKKIIAAVSGYGSEKINA